MFESERGNAGVELVLMDAEDVAVLVSDGLGLHISDPKLHRHRCFLPPSC